jgi:hypothetical protein
MKVAIVGSSQVGYHTAREAIDRTEPAMIGTPAGEIEVGTLLNGGVHMYARDLSKARGWSVTRFRSAHAIAKWDPDSVFMFWDGRSKGCLQVHEIMTSRRIPVHIFLMSESQPVRLFGTNLALIADKPAVHITADDLFDDEETDMAEGLWADAT